MLYQQGMSEEQYKQAIFDEFFKQYSYYPNFGKSRIDFAIAPKDNMTKHLLWAEAKNDATKPLDMLTQLILTVKNTYFGGEIDPPAYFAVFNSEEFHIYRAGDFTNYFFRNDIDWRARPSDYSTPTFKHLKGLLNDALGATRSYKFKYTDDIKGLKSFISTTFAEQSDLQGIDITLANLNHVFNKWCDEVLPNIALTGAQWKDWSKQGVYQSDFFLADAYVGNTEDATLVDSLKVGILGTTYFVKLLNAQLSFADEELKRVNFTDKGVAYRDFWKHYKRPPRKVRAYDTEQTPWQQILDRRDILVPRNIMERKGAFFTPRVWVEKAHEYLSLALGDNWQDEYTVFDCCAGSGNLLSGLHNQRNIFASDIDEQNVRIMVDETRPTFKSNIFQFDFLNDEFKRQLFGGKVPDALMDILQDKEKRKRLILLINPPYAESGNQTKKKGAGKGGVQLSSIHDKYVTELGKASRELYAQFLARIYGEFKGCVLAEFSTLKVLQGPNFATMREWFKPKLLSCFLVPGNSFDNVKGGFPIGFKIWDTSKTEKFKCVTADVYIPDCGYAGKHNIVLVNSGTVVNQWIKEAIIRDGVEIAGMSCMGNDFQQQNLCALANATQNLKVGTAHGLAKFRITLNNLGTAAVYFATRWSVEHTWLNHSDQFIYPHTDPLQDVSFVNDCLMYSIFEGHNHISVEKGENHWIPFTERALGVYHEPFKHTTLVDVLKQRGIVLSGTPDSPTITGLSPEAAAVYKAGYAIFNYYHTGNAGKPFAYSPDGKFTYNPDAALYDIRRFFQGTKANGNMNVKSKDEHYQALIEDLRAKLKVLRDVRIAPKVYEYGFLPTPPSDTDV